MAPPPRQLIDDFTAAILLRLPPYEPEHLFRAALVCKRWLRIICHPSFRRRYGAFHGTPPILGLLKTTRGPPSARFASTTSMPLFPHTSYDGWRTYPVDCRHGRVLIRVSLHGGSPDYLVWDPITGNRHKLPDPDIELRVFLSAAVLCAADGCDHLDCHGGPFRVVFADARDGIIRAAVYSSETGAWSVPVCMDNTCESYAQHMREGRANLSPDYTPYLMPKRGTLVGDAVYFTLWWGTAIVKYDLGKDRLSMTDLPSREVRDIALMAIENTSLGFAYIQDSSLYTWSRQVNTEEAAEWVLYRVIELEKTLPVANLADKPSVLGSADGVGVIFASSDVGLFTIKLNSGQVKKVGQSEVYYSVIPYMSFYTPNRGRLLSLARTH